jgi:hypothetical protein
VGGAVVAFAALFLQWSLSTELSRHQRLSDAQFRQYVELWSQLQELRQAAEDLWKKVNVDNLERFAKVLAETRHAVEAGKLILEAERYNELNEILEHFEAFRLGKRRVLDMRDTLMEIRSGNQPEILAELKVGDPDERKVIEQQIRANKRHRDRYEDLLDDIESTMRSQLGLPMEANTGR